MGDHFTSNDVKWVHQLIDSLESGESTVNSEKAMEFTEKQRKSDGTASWSQRTHGVQLELAHARRSVELACLRYLGTSEALVTVTSLKKATQEMKLDFEVVIKNVEK